jgi:hypothetical protein
MHINTHILIIGAGISGIAAAISASRNGKKVVLIDNHTYLGGAATASEVGTFCGLYKNGKDTEPQFLVDGFAKEFAQKVMEYCSLTPRSNKFGLHYLPYQTEILKSLLEDYIIENKVEFIRASELTALEEKSGLLKQAVVNKSGEQIVISFDSIVDCGKAIVAELTNHPFVESHYFQAASINFFVNDSSINDNEISNFKLIRELKTLIAEYNLPDYLKNLFIIPGSHSTNKIGFKFTIPWEISHEKGAIEKLTFKAKQLVTDFFELLKKHSPLFTKATIDHLADDLGWRTGKRPLGKYVLTEEDVISAKKWGNSVARTSWPIEDWLPDRSVDVRYVRENDYYEIPVECLMSSRYENLFFAGRIISATDRAIASARVMGVCLQTGAAAGKLASHVILP